MGDLTGGIDAVVWLLVPLVLGLALLTALALSADPDPDDAGQREGGVTRALARRDTDSRPRP